MGVLMILVIAAVYLLPGIIAVSRSHHQAGAIFALTILGGWSVIGWAVAFIWAVSAVKEEI
jgi:hypothetical protein